MSWKLNPSKLERLNRFGQTVDTPLFDQRTEEEIGAERRGVKELPIVPLPTRIYDGTQDKARVFAALKGRLTGARLKVFEAIFDLKLATDREIALHLGWEINRVTPRRGELQRLGLVKFVGQKPGQYGQPNDVWAVNSKALKLMLG